MRSAKLNPNYGTRKEPFCWSYKMSNIVKVKEEIAWVRLHGEVTWLPGGVNTTTLLDASKGIDIELHPMGVKLTSDKTKKTAIIPAANIKCMELK